MKICLNSWTTEIPEGYTLILTAEEAIAWIRTGQVTHIYFDLDYNTPRPNEPKSSDSALKLANWIKTQAPLGTIPKLEHWEIFPKHSKYDELTKIMQETDQLWPHDQFTHNLTENERYNIFYLILKHSVCREMKPEELNVVMGMVTPHIDDTPYTGLNGFLKFVRDASRIVWEDVVCEPLEFTAEDVYWRVISKLDNWFTITKPEKRNIRISSEETPTVHQEQQ